MIHAIERTPGEKRLHLAQVPDVAAEIKGVVVLVQIADPHLVPLGPEFGD